MLVGWLVGWLLSPTVTSNGVLGPPTFGVTSISRKRCILGLGYGYYGTLLKTLPWRPNETSFGPLRLTLIGVLRPHFWGAITSRKRYVLGVARSLCGSWASCFINVRTLSCYCFMLQTATIITRMWANAQRDGCPAEHRRRPLFNAAKFGWRSLLDCRAVTLPRRGSRWK